MSALQRFVDFETYSDTIADADLRMRVLGMEQPHYSLVQAQVGRLGVQWAEEGSGQLSEGATDRSAFGLYVQLDSRPRLLNGLILDPNAVVVFPPGSEFCFSCTNANSWFSIRIPTELLVVPEADHQPVPVNSVSVIRPGRKVMRQLRDNVLSYLHAIQLSQSLKISPLSTEIFENQTLDIARQLCFHSPHIQVQSEQTFATSKQRHTAIAKSGAEIIESAPDRSVSVAAVARSLGVSDRTLLTAFRSQFHMTPRRFIQSMRLNRARTKLRDANFSETHVQDCAADCGFWDFGRFAAKYQRLFGELPSQTLKKKPS